MSRSQVRFPLSVLHDTVEADASGAYIWMVSSTISQFPVRSPLPSTRWISYVMIHVQVCHMNHPWRASCAKRQAKCEIELDLIKNSTLWYFWTVGCSTCVAQFNPQVYLWWRVVPTFPPLFCCTYRCCEPISGVSDMSASFTLMVPFQLCWRIHRTLTKHSVKHLENGPWFARFCFMSGFRVCIHSCLYKKYIWTLHCHSTHTSVCLDASNISQWGGVNCALRDCGGGLVRPLHSISYNVRHWWIKNFKYDWSSQCCTGVFTLKFWALPGSLIPTSMSSAIYMPGW